MFTDDERVRYARQLLLPQIGEAGQERLRQGSVVIVGAGGLGSPAATYLAAAGVGRIGLVDFDRVDATNLHRQILYGGSSVGRPKLDAAAARLHELNDLVAVERHAVALRSDNALGILGGYDVVLDGTDNFAARYLINDACLLLGHPNVFGSVYRFDGQVSVFCTPDGPCYRCLHPEPPPAGSVPSCAEGGVLGVLPGVIGTLQALEAIKLLTGIGETLAGRLLLFDALKTEFRTVRLTRRCDDHPRVNPLIDYEEHCNPVNEKEISPAEVAAKLNEGANVVVVDVREPHEWSAGHIAEAKHIPLSQLPSRLDEIPREAEVIMVCRSGGRSGRGQDYLLGQGYTNVLNMTGGMIRWAREVDQSVRVI